MRGVAVAPRCGGPFRVCRRRDRRGLGRVAAADTHDASGRVSLFSERSAPLYFRLGLREARKAGVGAHACRVVRLQTIGRTFPGTVLTGSIKHKTNTCRKTTSGTVGWPGRVRHELHGRSLV